MLRSCRRGAANRLKRTAVTRRNFTSSRLLLNAFSNTTNNDQQPPKSVSSTNPASHSINNVNTEVFTRSNASKSTTTNSNNNVVDSYANMNVHSTDYADGGSDDRGIRRMFDEIETNEFRDSSSATGLFGNKWLTSARGLRKFTTASLVEAQALTQSIIDSPTNQNLALAIRNFDVLSDILCKVIDMVAFVRISHPSGDFANAAQEAHEKMYDYMNVLNTSVELHDILDRALSTPDIVSQLSAEEKTVGHILLADFKKSGVNLDPNARQKFVELSSKVSILGQQFVSNIGPAEHYVSLKKAQVQGLDPVLAASIRSSFHGNYRVPTYGPVAEMALQTLSDGASRQKLWLAQRTATDSQVYVLSEFLRARHELAHMMGQPSFAHYELKDKMARSPSHVLKFLNKLVETVRPGAQAELEALAHLKGSELRPWDRDYYSAKLTNSRRAKARTSLKSDSLPAYFSLGTVMQGLSRLFDRIYGIRFVPVATRHGEVWDEHVRRLDVVESGSGDRLGVIYCDLFQRDGKSPHPAHFTVQCSREIWPHEFESSSSLVSQSDDGNTIVSMTDSLGRETGRKFQLPIIALVCDFLVDQRANKCLLTYSEVQTLFHEMGHAIHSMLGRTSLHNVSGTRCATDFVELPSVLMERFAASPQIASLYARHHDTDAPLPTDAFQAHVNLQSSFESTETYHQILLSLLDQKVHSESAGTRDFDPIGLYHDLERSHSLFASSHADQNRWAAQFGHLFGYGATYYCYLFDRAIANRIWTQVFAGNPTDRWAGERFKGEVLAWGGSRDPWECVSKVLDEPELAQGDEQAMLSLLHQK